MSTGKKTKERGIGIVGDLVRNGVVPAAGLLLVLCAMRNSIDSHLKQFWGYSKCCFDCLSRHLEQLAILVVYCLLRRRLHRIQFMALDLLHRFQWQRASALRLR